MVPDCTDHAAQAGWVRETPGTNRLPRAVNPQRTQGAAFLRSPLGEVAHGNFICSSHTRELSLCPVRGALSAAEIKCSKPS